MGDFARISKAALLALGIGGIGGVGVGCGEPMPPMVPMVLFSIGSFERISRCAPFAGGRLAREHESGNARAGQFFELRRAELATTALWIQDLPHGLVEIAFRCRPVTMPFPPDREKIGQRLPPPVTLFRLARPDRGNRVPAKDRAPNDPIARSSRADGRPRCPG